MSSPRAFGYKHALSSGLCVMQVLQQKRSRSDRATFRAHDAPVTCMAYLNGHDAVATGDAEGSISVWCLGKGKRVLELKHAHLNNAVTVMCADFRGHSLLSGTFTGEIRVRVLPCVPFCCPHTISQ